MRSLAGSLADGVLADAILIPPRPLSLKSTETRDDLSNFLSRWLSAPDYIPTYITASRTSS